MNPLYEKALQIKTEEKALMDRAIKKVGEKFTGHVQGLVRHEKIWGKPVEITPELAKLGIYSTDRGVYMPVAKPYIGSAGRVEMAVAELLEGKTYPEEQKIKVMPSKIIEIKGQYFLEKTVITPRGEASAMAKINFGGTGVDTTNPVENAETSALARALGMLGYGLLEAGGLATAEEVMTAQQEQEQLKKEAKKEKSAAPAQTQQVQTKAAAEKPNLQLVNALHTLKRMSGSKKITDNKTQKILECPLVVEMDTGATRVVYGDPEIVAAIKEMPQDTVFKVQGKLFDDKNVIIVQSIEEIEAA